LSQRPTPAEPASAADATVYPVSEKLRLTIAYDEPDEEGWIVARVVEVPGALSQGKTQEEAREAVIDALRLMLAPDDDDPSIATGRSEQLELILAE
jgi:predicted RNase H-like HicB family nuclease